MPKNYGIDELEFRYKNAIKTGDFSPTQVKITDSNAGSVSKCIEKLKPLINWDEGNIIDIGNNKVRAKGLSLLWKTPNPPDNASAGAVITFNSDGSINLNVGVVEMGSAGQSQLAQMLAEKLKMNYSKINVVLDVDTRLNPEYWKTVASMTTFLTGRAVMNAADDVIKQLKEIGAIALQCSSDDVEVGNQKVYLKSNPEFSIGFQDLVFGLKDLEGNRIGKQIIGRGSYILNHISTLAKEDGKSKTGHSWTVGAQAVEIEFDLKEYTYRILKAATVMDVGKVIDPKTSVGLIQGGMSMGLSLASREKYVYNNEAKVENTSLRTYKVLHMGQEPKYLVEFVETPQIDSPYGTRSFSEHGIIGMGAALGNALSLASNVEINTFPITPELIFNLKGE